METFKFSHPILNENRYPTGGRRIVFYEVIFNIIQFFIRSWKPTCPTLKKPNDSIVFIIYNHFSRRWRSLTSKIKSQIF